MLMPLATVFMGVSIFIMIKLKWHFNEFYQDNRCLLTIASVTIFVPIMMRGLYNLLMGFHLTFNEIINLKDNTELENCLIYIFGELMPLISCLSSLVFGFIRKTNNHKIATD